MIRQWYAGICLTTLSVWKKIGMKYVDRQIQNILIYNFCKELGKILVQNLVKNQKLFLKAQLGILELENHNDARVMDLTQSLRKLKMKLVD